MTRTATGTRTPTPTRTGTATPTRTPQGSATRTVRATPTPTATFRTIGGQITAFGVARADGRVVNSIGPDDRGFPTFLRPASGFLIYLEAKPGISGRAVGTVTFRSDASDPGVLPDAQFMVSRALGNGSPAVCDRGPPPNIGGVPASNSMIFGGSQAGSNAINDLSCRFDARTASNLACTRDAFQQVEGFVANDSTIQFCTSPGVGAEIAFSLGDTTVTARVLDILGQPGPPASIVIRVLSQ